MEFLSSIGVAGIVLVILALILVTSAVKVVQEYERGVIFRLGRLTGAKGPGFFFIIPGIDRMMKIDLRVITLVVDPQEVITRDNVTVKVNAVLYFKVMDPNMAVVKVLDYIRATSQIAQTTLRSVLGQSDLDELLAQRVYSIKPPTIEAPRKVLGDAEPRPKGRRPSLYARSRDAKRFVHAPFESRCFPTPSSEVTLCSKYPMTLWS